jgi:AbrB family looped-hinge helix DNA binding protein
MKARVDGNGRVTIPKPLRKRLGIRAGDEIEFEEHEDHAVVRKLADLAALEALQGLVSEPIDVAAHLTSTRGPSWKPELDGEDDQDPVAARPTREELAERLRNRRDVKLTTSIPDLLAEERKRR